MAKGLRASSKKANKSLLRQNVFGPIEAARKERLSAKLLELASKSSPAIPADIKMAEEVHEGERGKKSMDSAIFAIFLWKFLFSKCYIYIEGVAQKKTAESNDVAKPSSGKRHCFLHAYSPTPSPLTLHEV